MKNGFVTTLKVIFVLPTSVVVYLIMNFFGAVFAWFFSFIAGSDIDIILFVQSNDFSGAGYLGGIWYLLWIRLPATLAFFIIPILFFPNNRKSAYWVYVALFVLVSMIVTVPLVLRFDSMVSSTESLVRTIFEVYVIPIIALIYTYKEQLDK